MEHRLLSFPTFFTFLLFAFMTLRIWKKSKTNNSTLHLPPGPWKLPLIGSIHHLAGALPHRRLTDLAKKHGPIMHLQLGELTNIVVSSPEIAKEVLKTHDITFAQRPKILASTITTNNVTDIAFAPYGSYWRQMRKIGTLELLTAKQVQSFRPIREEELSKVIGDITSSGGSPINFTKMIISLTYSIISRAAVGEIQKGEEIFIPAVKRAIEAAAGFSLVDLYPSIKFLCAICTLRPKLERVHHELDEILQSVIDEHKARKAAAKSDAEGEEKDLVVDVLLSIQNRRDLEFPLTSDNIKAVILDMFAAGSETSSTTVVWAMSEMLKNPRVMEKAQAEVRQVFSKKGHVDEKGLEELHYLQSVVKETLRLHPPIPFLLPRESTGKCVIHGYEIPVKSRMIVNAWAIGRDPNYWTEAERFYPERFLDKSTDYKGTNFEFIPFGAGRRICPGILFGIANVDFPLAKLLYHFDWKLPSELQSENLDMTEHFGVVVSKKRDLHLIPVPYLPPSVK